VVRKPEGRGFTWKTGVDEVIILIWILKISGQTAWTELIWFRIGPSGGQV
jgi:hypothetical protein